LRAVKKNDDGKKTVDRRCALLPSHFVSFFFFSREEENTSHTPDGRSSLQPGAAERRTRHGARVVEPVRRRGEEEGVKEREQGFSCPPIESIAHERIIISLSLYFTLFSCPFHSKQIR
jgi:hypothetical protein